MAAYVEDVTTRHYVYAVCDQDLRITSYDGLRRPTKDRELVDPTTQLERKIEEAELLGMSMQACEEVNQLGAVGIGNAGQESRHDVTQGQLYGRPRHFVLVSLFDACMGMVVPVVPASFLPMIHVA